MPLYEFRCPAGTTTDLSFSMATVPSFVDCPDCGAPAPRQISVPRLSRAGSPAMQVMDRTRRSAESPEVVTSIPAESGRRAVPRHTQHPLHQKLPRP
ncbi:zinc ribbon domain-containing protein [Citricoccus nitrophenolicus]